MSDLYHRLKQIRQGQNAGRTGSRRIVSPEQRATRDQVVPPAIEQARVRQSRTPVERAFMELSTDWERVAPGVLRKTHSEPVGLMGGAFAVDKSGGVCGISPILGKGSAIVPVFFDIESTGAGSGAGNVGFLYGFGRLSAQGEATGNPVSDSPVTIMVTVRQYFLEDYGFEAELIEVLKDSEFNRPNQTVVSYNGSSFDLPLLRTRFVMNRSMPPQLAHLDLLHPVRRLWKATLPDCSLSTVERSVLKFVRPEDLPSFEVPERYQKYLRTGRPEPLTEVFAHHLWDVVNLFRVFMVTNVALVHGDEEGMLPPRVDAFSLGRYLFERGRPEDRRRGQEMLFRQAEVWLRELQAGRLEAAQKLRYVAELKKRLGRITEAQRLYAWLYGLTRSPGDAVALAKILEHEQRQISAALRIVEETLEGFLGRKWSAAAGGWNRGSTEILGSPQGSVIGENRMVGSRLVEELEHRRARLKRKVEQSQVVADR